MFSLSQSQTEKQLGDIHFLGHDQVNPNISSGQKYLLIQLEPGILFSTPQLSPPTFKSYHHIEDKYGPVCLV